MLKISVVILALNSGSNFVRILDSVVMQKCHMQRKAIIDSESTDHTVQLARIHGFEIYSSARSSFNHGGTRKFATELLQDMDILIFMTQDAILHDENSIARLVRYFEDDRVGAAYGRQLPHIGASPLAAHARLFNYDDKVQIKSYSDKDRLGIKTPFLSDSYAAYRVSALAEVGGFPQRVIVSEDMYVGANLLKRGYKIVYAADSMVYHSHDYSLLQEFRRYFDIGVFQSEQPWIRDEFGAAEGEGLRFVKSQLVYLFKNKAYLWIIKAFFLNVMKLLGYRMGLYQRYLPIAIKKFFSGQSYYFNENI